jgi:transposase
MVDLNTENLDLPTIWTVPDELWEKVQCLLDRFDPPNKTGRKRIDARRALNGMIYRMRTGCQWNHLPKEFGDDASIHRTQQRWENLQLFDALWGMVASHCQELGGVDWEWQSADGCQGKARGVPKKGGSTNASARTLRIGRSRASRKVSLSKRTEGHLGSR